MSQPTPQAAVQPTADTATETAAAPFRPLTFGVTRVHLRDGANGSHNIYIIRTIIDIDHTDFRITFYLDADLVVHLTDHHIRNIRSPGNNNGIFSTTTDNRLSSNGNII